jgi:hypothetical protein
VFHQLWISWKFSFSYCPLSVVYLKNKTFGTKILGIVDFGIGGLGIMVLGTLGTYDVKSK